MQSLSFLGIKIIIPLLWDTEIKVFSVENIGVKLKVRNIWPKSNIKLNGKPIIPWGVILFHGYKRVIQFFHWNWLVKNWFWISTQVGNINIIKTLRIHFIWIIWGTGLSEYNLWKYYQISLTISDWLLFHDNSYLTMKKNHWENQTENGLFKEITISFFNLWDQKSKCFKFLTKPFIFPTCAS